MYCEILVNNYEIQIVVVITPYNQLKMFVAENFVERASFSEKW